jgi:hypothetical protein
MSEREAKVAKQAESLPPSIESADQRTELRATVRYSSGGTTPCKTIAGWRCNSWEATIRDISQQGIGLLLGRRFEPGVILVVELPRATEASSHLVVARVVRVVDQENGRWLVGCSLFNPLTHEELRALL